MSGVHISSIVSLTCSSHWVGKAGSCDIVTGWDGIWERRGSRPLMRGSRISISCHAGTRCLFDLSMNHLMFRPSSCCDSVTSSCWGSHISTWTYLTCPHIKATQYFQNISSQYYHAQYQYQRQKYENKRWSVISQVTKIFKHWMWVINLTNQMELDSEMLIYTDFYCIYLLLVWKCYMFIFTVCIDPLVPLSKY